jgi:hypothetical protein
VERGIGFFYSVEENWIASEVTRAPGDRKLPRSLMRSLQPRRSRGAYQFRWTRRPLLALGKVGVLSFRPRRLWIL